MNVTDQDVAALTTQARHLMAAKMFSLACCGMLYYDMLITFGDEVEKIWKQRFSFATGLWFMNRYLTPLGYVVIIVSFHDNWSKPVCNRYILYPEVLKIFTAAAIGVIFVLRLYSIYGGSMVVMVTFSVLLVAELAVKIWAFTDGTSVNLPPGLVGCILTGRGDSNRRFVFTWVAELVFDTVVFVATLSRTLVIYRRHRQGAAIPLIKIMMRDGIIYFLVIFAANVVTVTLFVALPPDLKAVNASFSTLITSLMVSRLILNLRNQAMRPQAAVVSYPSSQVRTEQEQDGRITSTVIGNLGEPLENSWFDDEDGKAEGQHYAMNSLRMMKKQANRSSVTAANEAGTGPATNSVPSQIVVEVTQTRSVTTDVHTADAHACSDVYPYRHEQYYAYPTSHPYAYPYPYRINGSFSLSQEGGSEEVDAPLPPAVSYSSSPEAVGRSMGSAEGSRPRSAGSEHLLPSRNRNREHQYHHQEIDEIDNEKESRSSSSQDTHSYNHTRPGRRRREEEDHADSRVSAGERKRGEGGWRPPQTWMLENVDIQELGRPRRSRRGQSRTRRPSTS